MTARPCTFNETFAHTWQVEILARPPLIAPARQYVYPQAVEEVELGALQLLLRIGPGIAPTMMTFALGFADPSLPHGVWSCPDPRQLCAIAGGYAYVVDTGEPERWMQIPYRPVTAVHTARETGLLVFAGFHKLWALGTAGQAWETARLSWEGVRVSEISEEKIHGFGWDMITDAEVPFTVNLTDGSHVGGAGPQ